MAKKILIALDFGKNEAQNMVIQNLSSAPSSPIAGQLYYDTTANRLYYRNGNSSAWEWKGTDSDLLQGQNGAYYLNRANHTGTQTASTISNLATTVQGYTLDLFAAAAASVNLNSNKIINLATPTSGTDAANKNYVDTVAQGLTPKPTATVATITTLPANTYANGTSGVGATLTGNSNGALAAIDGYTAAANDLILVKNEASGQNNGLYTLTQVGDGSHPYILTRHVDMDQTGEFGGAFIAVENKGTTTANTLWLCSNNNPTVGTTAITFTQLNAATSYTQGNGISISGNVVSAVATTGIVVGGSGIGIDTTVVARKYATTVGDGSSTSYTITHNLGTQDVNVTVYGAASTYDEVECSIQHTTTNTVTLIFATAPSSNQYRVIVVG